jgi:hypothetical protein
MFLFQENGHLPLFLFNGKSSEELVKGDLRPSYACSFLALSLVVVLGLCVAVSQALLPCSD